MPSDRPKYVKPLVMVSLIALAGALAACGSDKTKDDASNATDANLATTSPDAYRKKQQAFADSVLNTAKPVKTVVEQLGKGYEVGPVALRDTIASLAEHTNCFKAGRDKDPYLAGTVSVFAHMAVIGVDLIQVQLSGTKWTSTAGELVNACLDGEMKNWKLDMRYGKPAAYIVQVQFKTDSAALPHVDTAAKVVTKTGKAKAGGKKP
jgi:hypothetical protein